MTIKQMTANLKRHSFGRTVAHAANSTFALWRGSANINSSTFNKQCAFRQVSASNPPQRKAAKRYVQFHIFRKGK